jgi:putative membrane protein
MSFVPWLLLGCQALIVLLSLLGFGIFTARPDLLARVDPEARFFVWAFQGFAVGNMLLGGLAVVGEAYLRNGLRVVTVFGAVYFVSLASELLGTTYGVPFGAYSYTELLGRQWFGRVPYVIPLSWFTMAWPAWILARHRTRGWIAVLVGSALLVAWDLVLDPAMSSVTNYWIWGEKGSYYGMPWNNLLGWAVTGLVLLVVLAWLAPTPQGSTGFALAVYTTNLALPFGFCVLRNYWVAVAAGVASLLVATALALLHTARGMAGFPRGALIHPREQSPR